MQSVERRQYIMYPPCKQLYKISAGCGKETVYYVSTPANNYIKSVQGGGEEIVYYVSTLQATI